MPHYGPEIVNDVVPFSDNQGETRRLNIILQGLQASLMLCKGMDIGVVPEEGGLDGRLTPVLNAASGAGRTAGMNKDRLLHSQ